MAQGLFIASLLNLSLFKTHEMGIVLSPGTGGVEEVSPKTLDLLVALSPGTDSVLTIQATSTRTSVGCLPGSAPL